MANRYPTQAVKALGQRGNAMARALAPRRTKAPRAPKPTRGGLTSPRKPTLGPDTVGTQIDRPTGKDIPYTDLPSLSGGTGSYDVGSDPAVARIGALSARMRGEAHASAAAKRKQAVLEYGDPSGVEGIDEATATAARNNPFSILKALQRNYDTGVQGLEEGLNKANLFYSGYRGQQLGEAATGFQQQRYDAGTRFQGLMTDINDALASALLNADMMDADAAMGSDGGYYDPGGYYEEDPFEGYVDDQMDLPAALRKPKPKPKPKSKTVRVAGKSVPRAAAKKQLNRAIKESKVRAKPKPKPKAKAKPKKRSGV